MQSNSNLKNKYTAGKHLRRLKNMRKFDYKAVQVSPKPQLQAYRQFLQKQGMKVGPVAYAYFQTKNGLKYPGFIATQNIPANSVLLRIPVNSLLTTRHAYLSDIQAIFDQNPNFYSRHYFSGWQDRMLLTYMLYQYQKGPESQWYYLLQNLPRQIDYLSFWQEHQFKHLQDQTLKQCAIKQRQRVSRQHTLLLDVIKKYPKWFDPKIVTRQNMQWIHIHLVTRCFGSSFRYNTMVPYAQLFNHQCIDVTFKLYYNRQNIHKTYQQLPHTRTLTADQQEDAASSDSSDHHSDMIISDDQFQDEYLDPLPKSKSKSVQSQIKSIYFYLISNINFNDNISIPFLAVIYQQIQTIRKISDSNIAEKQLQFLQNINQKYLKFVKDFYTNILKYKTYVTPPKQVRKTLQQEIQQQNKKQEKKKYKQKHQIFEWEKQKDKFDEFLMVTGNNQQFQKGSQVYFCYGRLPNHLLLMRYGIALEHNKYNHIFIRIDVSELIYKCRPLHQTVRSLRIKKYRRFRVKRTKICHQLILYYRLMAWNYSDGINSIFYVQNLEKQKQVLKNLKQLFEIKLKQFQCSIQQNQAKLLHKQVGYHQYFAIVYKLQKQRIFKDQISMIDYAIKLFSQIKKKTDLEDLLAQQKDPRNLRYQATMQSYFKYFKTN